MAECNRQTPIPLCSQKSSLLDEVDHWKGDCVGKSSAVTSDSSLAGTVIIHHASELQLKIESFLPFGL